MKPPPVRRPGHAAADALRAVLDNPPAVVLRRPSQSPKVTPADPPPVHLATLRRGARAEIRISLKTWWGHPYLDVRWYVKDRADVFRASEKGISFHLEEVAALRAGLDQLEALAAKGNAA